MAKTEIRSEQIKNATLSREDINTTISGRALITKVIAGEGVDISSTGADSGTGDVTINAKSTLLNEVIHTDTTTGSVVRGDIITGQGEIIPRWTRLGKGAANQVLRVDNTASDVSWADVIASFGITIDGGGSVITTGIKGYHSMAYDATILDWTLLADQSGSCVIDVWKDSYANFPPTVEDTITGTEKPTLSSSNKNQNTNLTTWTTAINAGDTIAFNVDSASLVTRVHLIIKVKKKI